MLHHITHICLVPIIDTICQKQFKTIISWLLDSITCCSWTSIAYTLSWKEIHQGFKSNERNNCGFTLWWVRLSPPNTWRVQASEWSHRDPWSPRWGICPPAGQTCGSPPACRGSSHPRGWRRRSPGGKKFKDPGCVCGWTIFNYPIQDCARIKLYLLPHDAWYYMWTLATRMDLSVNQKSGSKYLFQCIGT